MTREATSRWTLGWQGSLADRVNVPVWLGLLFRLAGWLWVRPVKTLVALVIGAATYAGGVWAGAGVAAVLVGAGAILSSPGVAASGRVGRAYRACQARGRLRRRWSSLMADCGLVDGNNRAMPYHRITAIPTGLAVTAGNGSVGKTPADVHAQAERIAGLLDVHSVRTRRLTAAATHITIHTINPFGKTIKLADLPRVTTRGNACIGLDDAADPVLVSMALHLLLLGETGSGKSSVIWAILDAIQHWTDQPTPQLDIIDLKEGVELGSLDPALGGIATNYTESLKQAEALIHDTAREGSRRLQLMKANDWRKWRPAYADTLGPRRILVIDEFLALPKKVVKDENSPLREVLFKMRAAGITVIGASQLSQVDAGAIGRARQLFPQKLIMSMESQGMVQAVAGGEVQDAPAHTLTLPGDAGRFFLKQEGRSGWTSGKAAFVDDEAGEHLPIARGLVTA